MELLRVAPLLNSLSDADLAPIAAASRLMSLKMGQLLFREGDPSQHFFLVTKGSMRLYRLTPEGKEKVIEIISPGQTFAEAVALLSKPYPVYASALESTELIAIPSQILRDQVQVNHELAFKMLASLSLRIHGFLNDIHTLSLATAQQKVAGYLLAFLEQATDEQTIRLPATKAMIASRLGLQPETFSRVLSKMKEQGVIQEDKNQILILSSSALKQLRDTP
ncbi:Crp/Fnr family transcriptional regulator [Thiofilum flexile]|uniref:Crp/Fnr family transcriptional regulator n=1 Tax=Thiofilum flexile TaxID=125627 RepID=UPI000380422E|nr:Crp/Fnr family transcriptional regulator [Thiofilum flexile]